MRFFGQILAPKKFVVCCKYIHSKNGVKNVVGAIFMEKMTFFVSAKFLALQMVLDHTVAHEKVLINFGQNLAHEITFWFEKIRF